MIINLTFGQEKNDPTESIITEFKTEMKKDNISDFFIVKHITYGYNFQIYKKGDTTACKSNGYNFNMYGFWKKGNDTWIKKYDNCGAFNSVKLSDSKAMDFYIKFFDEIKVEEVERYTIKKDTIIDGIKHSLHSSKSHSPLRYYWFYKDSTEFDKNFDKYNLTTKAENKNVFYVRNNDLAIVKLNSICEKIIDKLNEEKLFNRLK